MGGTRGVRGVLETHKGQALAAREEWSADEAGGALRLKSRGRVEGERPRTFTLDASFGADGALVALDFQVALAPPPTEVTTFALRVHGGRAFGTAIPPGGVPSKVESKAERSFCARGFSTALDGFLASRSGLKAGHGQRMVVVVLDTPDLLPALADGMLLCTDRVRARTPAGEEWCNTYEFRRAGSGRADVLLTVTRAGAVLEAERPALGLSTKLGEFSAGP